MNDFNFFGKINSDMQIKREVVKNTIYVDFMLELPNGRSIPMRAYGDDASLLYGSALPGDRLLGTAQFFCVEKIYRFEVVNMTMLDNRTEKNVIKARADTIALLKQRLQFDRCVSIQQQIYINGCSTSQIRELAEQVLQLIAESPDIESNISNVTKDTFLDLFSLLYDGNCNVGYTPRYFRDLRAYINKWVSNVRA